MNAFQLSRSFACTTRPVFCGTFGLIVTLAGTMHAQTFFVTNTNNSGGGSLRQAILDMNSLGISPAEIRFQVSGTIFLSSPLPAIQVSVSINPNNVAGIVLDGSSAGFGSGLVFAQSTVQASNLRGIEIRNFSGSGVVISPSTSNEVVNIGTCYIHSNDLNGITISSSRFHHIGVGCVIQGNGLDGIAVTNSAVLEIQVSNSAIQANGLAGLRFIGDGHEVDGCLIILNGQAEASGQNNGGVVCGGGSAARFCRVNNSALAGNTPYGAKLVFGADNELRLNETYLNTTKGISAFTQDSPSLSHFVVDDVHDVIILRGTATGIPNTSLDLEFFVAYDDGSIATDEGAVFIDDVNVDLNSSGDGTFLVSMDRNVTFQGVAVLPNPVTFDIDNEDRLVATATHANDGTSEFSAVSEPTLPGDFNLDGSVDAGDYTIWRNNLGTTNAHYTQGDADFNGTVNSTDYQIWKANYGDTP